MKKLQIFVVCCFTAALVVIFAFFYMRNQPIKVNNETPADELITNDYSLKRISKLEALGKVYLGFDECNVNDLAEECGVELECKRQTSSNTFYYVVKGDGYRCFLFVDENDILSDVMVSRGFASQQKIKSIIEELEAVGDALLVDEISTNNLKTSYSLCRRAVGCDYLYFPLSDGMMIMGRPKINSDVLPEYYFYDNKDCQEAKEYWSNFLSEWDWSSEILAVDRTPWR